PPRQRALVLAELELFDLFLGGGLAAQVDLPDLRVPWRGRAGSALGLPDEGVEVQTHGLVLPAESAEGAGHHAARTRRRQRAGVRREHHARVFERLEPLVER